MSETASPSDPITAVQPEASLWFIFRGDRLLARLEAGRAVLPVIAAPAELGLVPARQFQLPAPDGSLYHVAEVAAEHEPPAGMAFTGLRRLYGLLEEPLFWLAGRAAQMVDWERNHQFCGRCGSATTRQVDEPARVCDQCGTIAYHNPAPAVIVLVERGDRLLLARAHRHPSGMYSVLAGFVEPGENLETAVIREIREEVGLEVRDITYFGSQPWPFPNSLMVAFTCAYAGGEIRLGENEIADAGWFSADNLPLIPPSLSIARQLIDWFRQKSAVSYS
jgi:NAD+ diphosphatase